MHRVTIHDATTHLSRLIKAALAGEDVVIARGNTPVARLVPTTPKAFEIGILPAQLGPGPDFPSPQDSSDLDLWEGGR